MLLHYGGLDFLFLAKVVYILIVHNNTMNPFQTYAIVKILYKCKTPKCIVPNNKHNSLFLRQGACMTQLQKLVNQFSF